PCCCSMPRSCGSATWWRSRQRASGSAGASACSWWAGRCSSGHYWEGRKPAFVDDIIGLIIGPLFVVAEAGFAFGLREDLAREIERRAGPPLIRQKTAAAG